MITFLGFASRSQDEWSGLALIESLPEIGVVQIIYPAGRRRVEKMHEFMEEFLKEVYEECKWEPNQFPDQNYQESYLLKCIVLIWSIN